MPLKCNDRGALEESAKVRTDTGTGQAEGADGCGGEVEGTLSANPEEEKTACSPFLR
jgi:hypothetical protein